MIPEGWRKGRFDEFITLQRGFDLPTQDRSDGQYPIIASNGIVGYHSEKKVDGPGVVTGRSGTIGKVSYQERDFWPLNTTLYVRDFHGNSELYAYYFLQHFKLDRFSNGTGVPTLNRNDVHVTEVIFPPKNEQDKITEIVSTWDKAIDLSLRELLQLKRIKKSVMKSILSGKNSKYKNIEDWDVKEIGELNLDISDGNYSAKYPKSSDFIDEGVPFIRANNIKRLTVVKDDMRYISEKQHKELKKGHLKKGDILLTNRGDIGELALVPDSFIGANINAQIVRINSQDKIDTTYLLEYLSFFKDCGDIEAFTTGSALKQLPISKLLKIPIRIPPKNLQKEIGEMMILFEHQIIKMTEYVNLLQLQKAGLMEQLLEGKKRVKV